MFSTEFNGYKKNEVDEFIANIKSDYEKALMEEKLKVLEAERKLLESKKKEKEIEVREKNILSMLETFKRYQTEGNRNIELLRSEQLKVVYGRLVDFLKNLNEREPGILLNSNYRKLLAEIEDILDSAELRKEEIVSTGTENDPMRMLLSKMNERRLQETAKEIRIERSSEGRVGLIKPVTEMKLEENDNYDNLVDKFLDTKPPEEQPRSMKIQSNGFDLKEAINPKDDLGEIMKAFDFYGGNDDEE